jgi:hypothetical protein
VLVTVPVPPPILVTVSVTPAMLVKVAVTVSSAVIGSTQVAVPEQLPPDQPVNTEPAAGLAVRVVVVLSGM